jgi:signal transduction histidine kinase
LAEKLRLERLLSELSARFAGLPSAQVDAAIEDTQRLIVETLGLDRSTLWKLAENGPGMVCTHYWQRPEWPPIPPCFRSDERLPWMQARVLRQEIIAFSSHGELPPEAACDLEVFRLHGPKSNVTIPLIANGQVFGAVAFSTLREERTWREDEVAELKLVAQIISNVVGRQRAEQREEQLRAELAHAMRIASLGELATAIAHELNQPLTAILSNAQAGKRFITNGDLSPAELAAILDDVIRDSKRAGSVIHNLRMMVSKRPNNREMCNINTLVDEVVELLHSEFIGEKIDVRLVLSPKRVQVDAVCVELQQVLVNLLMNAVHAMKGSPLSDRFIQVMTDADGTWATVIIRDRGPGIPQDGQSTVFAPFFSTKPDGLGLGLSICRRIIENHGGRISASNYTEGGACFSFALPLSAE